MNFFDVKQVCNHLKKDAQNGEFESFILACMFCERWWCVRSVEQQTTLVLQKVQGGKFKSEKLLHHRVTVFILRLRQPNSLKRCTTIWHSKDHVIFWVEVKKRKFGHPGQGGKVERISLSPILLGPGAILCYCLFCVSTFHCKFIFVQFSLVFFALTLPGQIPNINWIASSRLVCCI